MIAEFAIKREIVSLEVKTGWREAQGVFVHVLPLRPEQMMNLVWGDQVTRSTQLVVHRNLNQVP